ncbi:MAG: lysylphosphatidylglycerol synthase transmembrane domain-containing protein [Fodinibius sp.]|nr:lysylphosphatidylglycerol synthase transmembrane domain-containing protein [Fodinibius sp.]
MFKRFLKIGLALALGALFMWLAFRNVQLQEVLEYSKRIQFGWIMPFAISALCSHVFRALRWRLLIEHDKKELDRITLISGVLVGYLMNIVGPRLGEVSRPLYVAKKEGLSTSKLMGTIVLRAYYRCCGDGFPDAGRIILSDFGCESAEKYFR